MMMITTQIMFIIMIITTILITLAYIHIYSGLHQAGPQLLVKRPAPRVRKACHCREFDANSNDC